MLGNDKAKEIDINNFNDFPCGICMIGTSSHLPIMYGNDTFYKILNTNAEEMRLRYANCLETLLSVDDIKEIQRHLQNDESFNMEICVKNSIFVHTVFNCSTVREKSIAYMVCFDITSYKKKSDGLDSLLNKLDYIFTQTRCDVFEYKEDSGEITYASCKNFFDKPNEGEHLLEYLLRSRQVVDNYLEDMIYCFDNIGKSDETLTCMIKITVDHKDDKWVRFIFTKDSLDSGYILCILMDETAEKEATTKYLEEMLFYQAFLSSRDAYGQFDITEDKCLLMGGLWNLYNEVIKTKSYSEVFTQYIDKVVLSEDRKHYKETMECQNIIDSYNMGITHLGCEFRRIVEQNKMVWMEINIHVIKNPLNQHIMAFMYIKNIDRTKKRLLELTYRDESDSLTGVYNKKALESKAREYLLLRNIKKSNVFMIIDIDDLKVINKRHGIITGDKVLQIVAKYLMNTFKKDDIIGRFGGDEFLLLLKDCDDTEVIMDKLEKLKKGIQKDLKMPISFCVGMTVVTEHDSYEYAFQKAVSSLTEAKGKGIDNTIIYTDNSLDKKIIDIQEYNIREYENTFLKSTNEGLYQNSIDSIIGAEGEIAYLVDPDSLNLLCGNQAFYDRLGKSPSQCVGKKCYELMHNRTSPCPFCKKENWTDEKFFMYRDFNKVLEQEFLIKNKLIESDKKVILLAIAVDLSNKSFIDSIENETTENNHLLNGLEDMQKASSLDETFITAFETISNFFSASSVHFWEWDKTQEEFICIDKWHYPQQTFTYNKQECQYVSQWLKKQQSTKKLIRIESQDFMLCESVEIYYIMKKNNVENQVWYIFEDDNEKVGYIEIDGVSINYQNDTFLKTFIGFLQSEWKKKKVIDEILYNNYHDKLTCLMNRNSYDEYIKCYDKEKLNSVGIIFMNLNQMTEINDEHGTSYGDSILVEFAKIISTVCQNAYIFRLNGDEFMVVAQNVGIHVVEECVELIEKHIHNIGTFTVSIGYSWDNLEKNFNKLVNIATQSMEIHKQRYYDGLDDKTDNHYEELGKLISGIENNEFQVYLQAKVDSRTGNMFGAEALIRYIHPEFGVIPPGKFIPIVEKKNMIRYIDLFVFEEVCKCLDRWNENGMFCPVISLNFSRKTLLEDHLVNIMDETVKKYRIDKRKVEIEITEGEADVGTTVLYQVVNKIREAGYSISLDDFGTNYTNLNILSELDFDTLKLDRSLIYSLNEQVKNRIILKNMIEMCEELDVEVIAEGVETIKQRDILSQLGCTCIQGYLYSKPIPIEDFEKQFIKDQ